MPSSFFAIWILVRNRVLTRAGGNLRNHAHLTLEYKLFLISWLRNLEFACEVMIFRSEEKNIVSEIKRGSTLVQRTESLVRSSRLGG
jgi:hypothetical protein